MCIRDRYADDHKNNVIDDYCALMAASELWIATGKNIYRDEARKRSGNPVSYTHLRAHETVLDLVCRLLLEKKTNINKYTCNRNILNIR